MSTVQEIEQAIDRLSATERNALESRLLARRCGLSALNEKEQAKLLASLDQAEDDINEGRSYSAGQVRRRLQEWIGK